jgi:prolyl 4-hydroxylase|tara:strand:+ start:4791 stop:5378 length:588 start_codon:yes stop_codon:yes gene_type:complete
MIKEYKLPFESFIGGWFIDTKICDQVIDFYKKTPDKYKSRGHSYRDEKKVINKKVKDSLDLYISPSHYLPPFGSYRDQLQICLENYLHKYSEANRFSKFNVNEEYNIQYYKPKGGFKKWHSERSTAGTVKRVLVFMTFLNDVPNGGTMFKYQNITVPAKKGLTLIWPTDFTHTHKGKISKTHDKYIVTGWYTLND